MHWDTRYRLTVMLHYTRAFARKGKLATAVGGIMVNFELMTRAKPMMPRENMLVGHAQNAKDLTRSLP